MRRWSANPSIEILGSPDAGRLSIVSFVVRHDGRYLHHNFVVALLNDLFGIQSRGGCSCAGPYGHRLLGIDIETSHEFEREITRGCEGIKPGWVRVNFNYFISEAVFEFLLDAVDLVATDGWRLLPDYAFEPATGLWRHRAGRPEPPGEPARRPLRRRARWTGRRTATTSRSRGWRRISTRRARFLARPVVAPATPSFARGRGRARLRGAALVLAPRGGGGRGRSRAWLRLAPGPGGPRDRPRHDGGEGRPARPRWPAARARPGRLPARRRPRRPGGAGSARLVARRGAACRAIDGLADDGVEVLAVCGVGQGPTLTVIDEAGLPLRPAITWQDRRPGDGGFGLLPRMAWLAREDPDAAAQARWLMPSWDALGLWLSGEAATSVQGHETPLGAGRARGDRHPAGAGAGTAPVRRAAGPAPRGGRARSSGSGRGSPSWPA